MFKQVKKVGKIRKMKAYGVIGVLAMGVLSGTNATSAFADEVVKPVETADAPAPEVPKPAEKTEAEKLAEVKESVSEVKDEINTLSDTLRDDKAVIDSATAEVAELNKEVEGIEASLAEATPEAVAEVKENIATAENKVSELTNSLPSVESSVSGAETAKTEAEASLNEAKVAVDNATAELESAEEAVAEVNKSIETIESGGVGERLKTLKVIADADKASLDTATSELETATAELAKLKKETENALTEKGELEVSLGEVETALEGKKAKVSETADNIAKVDAEIAKLADVVNAQNTITVSPEYVEALRSYARYKTREERDTALAKLKGINQAMREANVFKHSEADKSVVITNINNLTDEQLTDFSLFMAKLVNDVRKQMGTTPTEVTSSSVNVVDTVTDNYVTNRWNFNNVLEIGHDRKALDSAKETTGVNMEENLNSWGITASSITLDKLKELGYRAMVSFLFNGHEWLHAKSVAGFNADLYKTEKSEDWFSYIGADISTDGESRISIHMNEVNRSRDPRLTESFNRTPIENTYDNTKANDKLTALNTTKEVLTESLKGLNREVSGLETRKSELEVGIQAYVNRLNSVKEKDAEVVAKTSEVDTLMQSYATSKDAYDRAVAESADIEATLRSLKENLATKEKALESKTGERNRLWGIYESKLSALNDAKAKFDLAVANVEATKIEIEKNKGLVKTYNDKLAVWSKLSEVLVAKKELLTAKSEALKAKLDKTEADLAKLKQLELKLAEFVSEWKSLEIELYGKVVSPELVEPVKSEVKPEEGKDLGVETGKENGKSDKPAKTEMAKSNSSKSVVKGSTQSVTPTYNSAKWVSKGALLPKTGGIESVSLTAIGTILSSLGVLGFRRKVK